MAGSERLERGRAPRNSPEGERDGAGPAGPLLQRRQPDLPAVPAPGPGRAGQPRLLHAPHAPGVLGGPAPFHRRMETKSPALLQARPGQHVLDACRGRGHTTARPAAAGCEAVGGDITAHQIAGPRPVRRRSAHDVRRGRRHRPATAGGRHRRDGRLVRPGAPSGGGVPPRSPDRHALLAEALRVLRPCGRFVPVDSTWHTDDPAAIRRLAPRGLVRGAWRFEEFEPLTRNPARAAETGFVRTAHGRLDPPGRSGISRVSAVTRRARRRPPRAGAAGPRRPACAGSPHATGRTPSPASTPTGPWDGTWAMSRSSSTSPAAASRTGRSRSRNRRCRRARCRAREGAAGGGPDRRRAPAAPQRSDSSPRPRARSV